MEEPNINTGKECSEADVRDLKLCADLEQRAYAFSLNGGSFYGYNYPTGSGSSIIHDSGTR